MLGFTFSTPSSSPTNSFIWSLTWGPIGQPGEVSVKVMFTSAPVDLDLVDQAELHEVEPELRVDHVGEGLFDFVDGWHAVHLSSLRPCLCWR